MKLIWRTAIVMLAARRFACAVSHGMNKASKRDKMSTTYTGCVRGNHGASFLTHVAADREKAMKDDMMKC